MSTKTATKEFSGIRSFLWPVHNFELKKLLPMLLMFFCISFNYTILRDTKDTLIVTASGSGAEAILFLKFWGVVPAAILFTLIYAKLSNILSKENLFYAAIAPFLIFFVLFPTVLYPNRDILHPTEFADTLQAMLPQGFMGMIAMLRNWTYSLFYILAELWGSAVISLMFWGFANEITRTNEAKRFYTLFGLGANVALPFSGMFIRHYSQIRSKLPTDVDAWGVTLNYLMGMSFLMGVIIVGTYYWMNRNVLTDKVHYNPEEEGPKKKKVKAKLSLGESAKMLMRSKYLGCLVLLVIGYGMAINLVEVTWKSQLKLQYPDPNDYSAFMGGFSAVTGPVTVFMLFCGGAIIRRFGWGTAAITTPVVLLITGGLFFTFIMFREQLTGLVYVLGATPLYLAVMFGAAQNIASKSTKYSLFDPTKEMAYIPLDQESKVKGKAAIDVVGARLGKSGGALIQQLLVVVFGSLAAVTPIIAGITGAVIFAWIFAAKSLSGQIKELQVKKDEEASKEATAEAAKTVEAAPAKDATSTAS